MTAARKEQFLRLNPRVQVITKTDLAKVESCFALLPDVACRGAEKSFVAFAERISEEWKEEGRRAVYGDDWFRAAVAQVILFRTAERLVSEAPWYEGGYRAQIVAYTTARLARLAEEQSGGGRIDHLRIWATQSAGEILESQMSEIGQVMAFVLRNPPQAGQNISEWAKQQACRKRALETDVPIVPRFDSLLVGAVEVKAARKNAKAEDRIDQGLVAVTEVMRRGGSFWRRLQEYAKDKRLLLPDDERALRPAMSVPGLIPSAWQAERVLGLLQRCEKAGFRE